MYPWNRRSSSSRQLTSGTGTVADRASLHLELGAVEFTLVFIWNRRSGWPCHFTSGTTAVADRASLHLEPGAMADHASLHQKPAQWLITPIYNWNQRSGWSQQFTMIWNRRSGWSRQFTFGTEAVAEYTSLHLEPVQWLITPLYIFNQRSGRSRQFTSGTGAVADHANSHLEPAHWLNLELAQCLTTTYSSHSRYLEAGDVTENHQR